MDPAELAGVLEEHEVAPDRDVGDAEAERELGDRDAALLLEELRDDLSPLARGDDADLRAHFPIPIVRPAMSWRWKNR